ncbi:MULTISPECIES: hypothetical protein [Vibrio]|uniref:hypothetical protein n=1 Tax=Vibrio TaxID=662 RepID=UPI000AB81AD2|nr:MULTISPECIES: hypothetical protein [Vibrio]
MLLMLVFLIITLSSIPLPASLMLIYLLGKLAATKVDLLPTMQGEVEFISPTRYKTAQGVNHIRTVNYVAMAFGLLITRSDNKREILWRDSLPEASYRHIVVMLKREH